MAGKYFQCEACETARDSRVKDTKQINKIDSNWQLQNSGRNYPDNK